MSDKEEKEQKETKKKKVLPPEISTIKLAYPVTIEGVTKDTVTMRLTKIGDVLEMEKASGTPLLKEVNLIAKLCGVPSSFIEELKEHDYEQLQKVLNGEKVENAPLSDPQETSESGAPAQPET